MKYADTDMAALKSPDTMRAYAEARLDGRPVGRGFKCACPWGAHNDPRKVEITEYHGEGRATCWACGKNSVDIFKLAAACSGIPDDKEHFAELMAHIADATGYRLTAEQPAGSGRIRKDPRAGSGRPHHGNGTPAAPLHAGTPCKATGTPQACAGADGGASAHTAGESPAEGHARHYLEESARLLAVEAVDRAAACPDKLAALAADLNLPARALTMRTDKDLHLYGLIGLTPRGLLLFISTVQIFSGKLMVQAIKARAPMHGTAPAEVIEGGAWVTRGTMDASRQGGKFRACTKGTGAALWGADALRNHDTAIITEGESDKMAIDLSLDAFREAWQTGIDDMREYVRESVLPAVVACAGASAFKEEWAALFKGKAVIICGDNDAAGLHGVERTAALLRTAGAAQIRAWTPRAGYKDAREQYNAARPLDLIDDIMKRAESYTITRNRYDD